MKTKIKKYGIEIEGEFSDELTQKLNELELGRFVSDVSLYPCNRPLSGLQPKGHSVQLHCLEYVTHPLICGSEQSERNIEKIFSLLDTYHKKGHFHYNKTMGMHIHFSFEPKLPSEIWSIEFVRYFEKQVRRTFPGIYSTRTNGTYCKRLRDEKEVSQGTNRYREINFRSAFNKHGTIEFRLFPADKPKRMRRFLNFTEDRLNGFIRKERVMLSKSFEFEVGGKGKITKTQKVEITTRSAENDEIIRINCKNVLEEEIIEEVIN